MAFDPIQYKTTTRWQWEQAAGFVGPCELLVGSGSK
jgi:hypothetical protein